MLICTIQKTCIPQNMVEELEITGPVGIHRFGTCSVPVIELIGKLLLSFGSINFRLNAFMKKCLILQTEKLMGVTAWRYFERNQCILMVIPAKSLKTNLHNREVILIFVCVFLTGLCDVSFYRWWYRIWHGFIPFGET